MDAELKRKWVAELRSGKYEQGPGHLQKSGRFCCLGVLCASAGATWQQDHIADDGSGDARVYSYVPVLDSEMLSLGEDEELNEDTLRKFGITDEEQKRLVAMNDDEGKSFAEIADYIEGHL